MHGVKEVEQEHDEEHLQAARKGSRGLQQADERPCLAGCRRSAGGVWLARVDRDPERVEIK